MCILYSDHFACLHESNKKLRNITGFPAFYASHLLWFWITLPLEGFKPQQPRRLADLLPTAAHHARWHEEAHRRPFTGEHSGWDCRPHREPCDDVLLLSYKMAEACLLKGDLASRWFPKVLVEPILIENLNLKPFFILCSSPCEATGLFRLLSNYPIQTLLFQVTSCFLAPPPLPLRILGAVFTTWAARYCQAVVSCAVYSWQCLSQGRWWGTSPFWSNTPPPANLTSLWLSSNRVAGKQPLFNPP